MRIQIHNPDIINLISKRAKEMNLSPTQYLIHLVNGDTTDAAHRPINRTI